MVFAALVSGSPALADAAPDLRPVTEFGGPTLTAAGDGESFSADGRFVVFESNDRLTPDAIGDERHVYRKSMADSSVELVSTRARPAEASGASYGASISADGRYIAFETLDDGVFDNEPTPLGSIQVALKDMDTGRVTQVSTPHKTDATPMTGDSDDSMVSADGQHVVFVSTVPGMNDKGFVPTGSTPTVDEFDVATGDITNVSAGVNADTGAAEAANDVSGQPVVSADGRYVAYTSKAGNLGVAATTRPVTPLPVTAWSQIYRWDRTTGKADFISASATDTATGYTKTDNDSVSPTMSGDGSLVGFVSAASNLLGSAEIPKKSQLTDAYIHNVASNVTHRVSLELHDAGTPDVADSAGHTPSSMRSRWWQEAVAGATGISLTADGHSAILTSMDPLVDISGGCVGCQQFHDYNNASDIYEVGLSADGQPESMQPISAKRNNQNPSTTADLDWETDSTTGAGDSIADGKSPATADGSLVAFASQADDLRGWDKTILVKPGDMSFADQGSVFAPNDARNGNLMEMPHFLDGGFPGSSDPRVRLFTAASNSFATHLDVTADAAEALTRNPRAVVQYETRRQPLPSLTAAPARVNVQSHFLSSRVVPGAHGVSYNASVGAVTDGSAVIVFNLNHFTLASEIGIPTGWTRAQDDVSHTITYTNPGMHAGDRATFTLTLDHDDNGFLSAASATATSNAVGSVANVDVIPAAPGCNPVGAPTQTVIAGLPTTLVVHCVAGTQPLSVHAGHGAATIDAYGTIKYTPDTAYQGMDVLTVTSTDRGSRTSSSVSVPVTVAVAAHIVDHDYSVAMGTTLTVNAADGLKKDATFPTDSSGWGIQQGMTLPKHGTLTIDAVTGAFVYVPTAGYTGDDSFRYRVNGPDTGAFTNTATVTIHITK